MHLKWSVYIYVIQTQYKIVLVEMILQTFKIKTEDFLSPQFIPKAFVNDKVVFDAKLTLNDQVSTFNLGGKGGYVHTSRRK